MPTAAFELPHATYASIPLLHMLAASMCDQVKEAEELFGALRLKAAALLRRRGAAETRLRGAVEVLQSARAALVAAGLQERSHDEVTYHLYTYTSMRPLLLVQSI